MNKSILRRLTSILLCLCMLLSTYGSYLPFFAAGADHDDTLFDGEISLADVDLDNAKHFIIRHWHVVTENADIEDDTVVVEGYIVPNGESYDYYARTYSPLKGVAYDDDLEGFTRITESTVSSYIKLAGGKLEFMINPYHSDEEYYERFAGFSVSSGQHAVSLTDGDADNNYDGAKLTIDPSVNAPLIKSHVFYTCELLYVDGTTDYKDAEGKLGAFPDYIDTYVDENGVKHYNSAAGLHTDKTASAYDDGRTFDLDLEAWFSGARQIDVGMILDASGSMAYTMDTLEKKANTKIDVDAIIRKLNRSSDPEVLKIAESLSQKKLTGSAGTIHVTEANILSAEELAYILNTSKTDASPLGINGYTYFVYDKRSGVNEYVPLAYWDGAQQRAVGNLYAAVMSDGTVVGGLGNASNHNQFKDAGWYYVNFGSALLTNYLAKGLESGKALWGLFGTGVAGYAEGAEFNTGAGAGNTNNNTGNYIYSHNSGKVWSPIQFIIGVDGKLCAFFNSEAKISGKQGVSYVYENPDSSYTKVEALQRAVGTFSTKLFDAAPSSHIAAVRFSTGDSAVPSNYDKFVLLDWTNDAVAAAKMLSLEYGTGGTIEGDKSPNGKIQYNYGLTGNTNTEQGLAAFLQELSRSVGANDKKYVIIFTDGRDSIYNSLTPPTAATSEAYRYAQQLKVQGYTIFTALLATGTVANGMGDGVETEDHQKAAIFLKALAGTDKESGEDYFYEATDADSLVEAFARDILGAILDDLDDYNAQDYIDPRFDLVDADGVTWHLNADGNVIAGSKTFDLLKGDAPVITLSADPNLSDGSEKAVLKYDDDNDLYYLVWYEQNIPGCAPEASKLEVWHARITVRAKEDFIGGNAVLTNGNSDTQNYVYKLGEDSSSGIDMSEGGKDDNPSRGFPRTTVNVKILTPGAIDGSDDFYKGETPEEFLKGLLMGLNTSDSEANPYLDYFWRYWNQCNNTENPELAEEAREAFIKAYKEALGLADDAEVDIDFIDFESFIDAIVEALCSENHTFTLPYAYLPDIEKSEQVNQTGTADHESDVLGDLIFVWNWGSDSEDSGELEIFFQAYDEDTRTESTEDLIKDKDFEYDREYKPVEGDAQDRAEAEGGYLPEYVPGELAVKLIADPYDIKWLFSEKGDWKGLSQKDFTVKVNRLEDITEGKTRAAENGEMTMTVSVKPNGEAIFYSENLSELSKGTYLMTFENGRGMYGKHVTATFRIADNSEYTERFERDGDKTVGDLIAPNESGNNSATFELGSNEDAQADYSYLNDRYGMVVITLTVDHGVLTIRKEFADKPQTNSDDKNLEFEFTVTLSESGEYEYQVYGADQKPIAGRSGTIHSGESVVLKAGEYVVIDGLPVGTRYTVTEKTVTGFESSVGTTVTPTVSGVITVTSEETGAQEVTVVFSNKKTRNPVYVSLNGKKLLTGDNAPAIKAGDYSFTITPAGNNPENDPLKGGLTVKNAAPSDGSALIKLFDNVKYELADEDTTATYIYTVEEAVGSIPGIIYAKTTYEIKIVISEKYVNGVYTGELTADVYVNGKAVTDLTSGSDVKFENKFDQNAHLNIDGTKTVNGGAPDKSFQFKLTLESGNPDNVVLPESTTVTSDKTSGAFSFGDIVFKAEGVYTFKVSEIEVNNTGYILAEPVMIVVTVTRNSEYNTLETTVTVDGKAAVSDPKSSASITVTADNTKLDEFILEISKTVSGLLGDKTMFFEFTVTLVRPDGLLAVNFPTTYDLDGDAGAVEANGKTLTFKEQNGAYVADVKLKDGQTIIIKGLLEGTKYTVEEKNYSDLGYTTTWHSDDGNGSGSFKSGEEGITKDVSVDFLNVNPAGTVSVTKTVISPESSDKDTVFSFNMTIQKPGKWSDIAFKAQKYTYTISGSGETEEGELVLSDAGNGMFTVKLNDGKSTKQITLKHGQTLEISNLPVGTTVNVTEDSAKGYTTEPVSGSSIVVSEGQKGEIVFTNTRDTGDLTVSKTVTGESADPDDEFLFTVTLKDSTGKELTGEYTFKTTGTVPAYEKFTSGAAFKLKHGETFTIYGLPTGTVYEVEETPADGYKTTADGKPSNKASGTVTVKGAVYTAEYVNEHVNNPLKESDPATGIEREIGKEIIYKITWENYKYNPATVMVSDALDAGLDYMFGTAMAYRYDPDTDTYKVIGTGIYKDHVLTWTLQDQPALSHGYVTFTAIVNEKAMVDSKVVNDALVKVGNDSWFRTNEVEHPVPKGDLEVSKTVVDENIDPDEEFTFTVQFSYSYKDSEGMTHTVFLDGDYCYTINGGDTTLLTKKTDVKGNTYYEFTLKHGDTIKIPDLPAGVHYVIEEGPSDGYKTTADGQPSNSASGTITTKGAAYKVEYVNERADDPVKESDPESGTEREIGNNITYTVTWENYKNNSADVTVVDELDAGLDYMFGTAMAYRYDPDTDTYKLIGTGIYKDHVLTWILPEQPALSRGYVTFTVTVNEKAVVDGHGDEVVNDALVKVGNDSWFRTNEVKHPIPRGDLEVSKKVVDDDINTNEAFTFTVQFSYNYEDSEGKIHTAFLSGDYYYTINGGDAALLTKKTDEKGNTYYEFTLKHGDTIRILDLPAGVYFTIEEAPSDGYRTTADGKPSNKASGTITAEGSAYKVEYVNERADDPVKESDPESGTEREIGNNITYTVTWENYKNHSADVTVVDELDAGLDYIAGTAKAYRYDPETDTYKEIGTGVYKDHVLTWTMSDQPALSRGYVKFTAAINEKAVTDGHGDEVVNDALVKVGNDSWFRTNEVEHPVPKGDLEVSKKVIDENIDTNEAFTFTVQFSYNYEDSEGNVQTAFLSGDYYYTINGGDAALLTKKTDEKGNPYYEFMLKHGDTVRILDLPAGVYFTVEEAPSDGYRTTVDGKPSNKASGTITAEGSAYTVEYVNERVSDPVKDSDPVSGTMREVGNEITYTVTWENYKNNSADVTVVDELDPGLDYIPDTAKAYRYDPETDTYIEIGTGVYKDHVLTWTMPEQPALSHGYVIFTTKVNEDAIVYDHGNEVVNDALVKVGNDGWFRTNEVEHPIPNPEKSEVTPGEGKIVQPDSEITYEITWENYKEYETVVTIIDPLDANVEFVSAKFGAFDEEGEWYTVENAVDGILYDAETHTVIWTIDAAEAKAYGKVTLVVRVTEGAITVGVVKNQASVQVDNDPEVKTRIIENPAPNTDVTILKEQAVNDGERTTDWKRVQAGDIVTYYITVTNIGDIAAEGLVITDEIPEGLKLVNGSISHDGWESDGVITWNIGTLEAGEAVTVSFNITVPTVEKDTVWLNIAVETHNDPEDPTKPPRIRPSNEVEIRTGDPELTIQKSQAINDGEPTVERRRVEAGDRVTYYLTVTNIGNGTAFDIVITDEIPEGLTLVIGSISNDGRLLSDGKTIVWQVESMEPGDSITVSFQITVPEVEEITRWENIAILTYDNPDDHNPEDPTPDDPSDPAPEDPANPDPDDPHGGRIPIPSNIVEIEEFIDIDNPETGSGMSLQLWIILFVISGVGLVTTFTAPLKDKSRKQQ